jgi:hypothetical protein
MDDADHIVSPVQRIISNDELGRQPATCDRSPMLVFVRAGNEIAIHGMLQNDHGERCGAAESDFQWRARTRPLKPEANYRWQRPPMAAASLLSNIACLQNSRKLVEEEIGGSDLAIADDDEIGSGVSRGSARAARRPTDPAPIAYHLGLGERLILEVGMSGLYCARHAVDLVATAVNAVGLVEYGLFVEDLVDRSASTHRIDLSKYVMQIAK